MIKKETTIYSEHFRISLDGNDPSGTQYHALYGTTYQKFKDYWRSSYLTIDVERAKEIRELMDEYIKTVGGE